MHNTRKLGIPERRKVSYKTFYNKIKKTGGEINESFRILGKSKTRHRNTYK